MSELWRNRVLMFIVMLIAAMGWFFSKQGIRYFEPFEFMAIRFSIGTAFLLGFAWQRRWLWGDIVAGLRVGSVFFVSMVFWILALERSTMQGIGLGGFIITLGVVVSPIIGFWLFSEPFGRGYWWALALAVLGGVLMAPGFQVHSLYLFIAAATLLGLYMTLMTRASRHNDPVVISIVGFVLLVAGMTVLSAVFEQHQPVGSWHGWGWVVLSGAVATALRFLLQARVQGRLVQSEASLIMNLEGVAVVLIAVTFTGVSYHWIQWAGAALVVAAVLVMVGRQSVSRAARTL